MTTLLLLSGPSCVGKGPLLDALQRCHPELAFAQPIVHTCRTPRPGERDGVDFHFRTFEQIEAYDRERYFVYPMRNQNRAIDLDELGALLAARERVILELSPPRVQAFRAHPGVAAKLAGVRQFAVLLQPLSVAEALALAAAKGCDPARAVADVMLPKQLHRATRLGQLLDVAQVEDLLIRAAAAWAELQPRPGFDLTLVNHDAEGDDHWRHTPPIGDAGRTLAAVAALLRGDPPQE